MILEGTALVIAEDDVDTDVLYPGPFLSITDPEKMPAHLFEGLDPTLRDRCAPDTILVVGRNFGSGSSREHVPQAMLRSGIRAVVGESFARIFYRNCLNLGLPAVVAPGAVAAASDGSRVRVDLGGGEVELEDGTVLSATPLPGFVQEMIAAGGLVPWSRQRANA